MTLIFLESDYKIKVASFRKKNCLHVVILWWELLMQLKKKKKKEKKIELLE